MPLAQVAYNPNDPTQTGFLAALAAGESNPALSFRSMAGFGNVNLTGAPTDQYGFPQWGGDSTAAGPTHAAGTYQFQPGTWDSIAAAHGLNFQNAGDQDAGAWYYAQQVYSQNTGGQSLETALSNGQYGQVQSALSGVWTSVTGSAGNPAGLAAALSNSVPAANTNAVSGSVSEDQSGAGANTSGSSGGSGSWLGDLFTRGALLVVGGLVLIVALWKLLADQGYAPHPSKVASKLGV